MAKRQIKLTGFDEENLISLNEELDKISEGFSDNQVKENADIGNRKMNHVDLGIVKVGTAICVERHFKGKFPFRVSINMQSAGQIWEVKQSQTLDTITLKADAADREAHIIVFF